MPVRVLSYTLELDIDRCNNVYGSAPCTAAGAAGSECYNTRATCQDPANYDPGVHTIKFTKRGSPIPAGELVRPLIDDVSMAPTEIDIETGYARRSSTAIRLADDTGSDIDQDPYHATRAAPAAGTFWARFLARNPYWQNRTARISRAFILDGVWQTPAVEQYIIDSITGPDRAGTIRVTLKDPTKRVDRTLLPGPTDGRLQADLNAAEFAGVVVSAAASTVVLPDDASPVDGFYDDCEAYITARTGEGQRRIISSYVGATRTATLTLGWTVLPDSSSSIEIGKLSLDVGSAYIGLYKDPAVTGKREFVAIGSEVIEYESITGSALEWADTTRRASFGTTREDHRADDEVQQCWVQIEEQFGDVAQQILDDSGVPASLVDGVGFDDENDKWLGDLYRVTVCITEPTDADELLEEMLPLAHAVIYWDPVAQKTKFRVVLPSRVVAHAWGDDAELIDGSVAVSVLHELRRTRWAVSFAIRDVAGDIDELANFERTELAIEADAEDPSQYGDVRPESLFSRWFGAAGDIAMRAWVKRQLILYRDAPREVSFELDPKDAGIELADFGTLTTAFITDETGAAKATRILVTRVEDLGNRIRIRGRTTTFEKNYGYIAPNTAGNHPSDSEYAHVSDNAGLMGDGSDAYLII